MINGAGHTFWQLYIANKLAPENGELILLGLITSNTERGDGALLVINDRRLNRWLARRGNAECLQGRGGLSREKK
jgi:hypothetical protein